MEGRAQGQNQLFFSCFGGVGVYKTVGLMGNNSGITTLAGSVASRLKSNAGGNCSGKLDEKTRPGAVRARAGMERTLLRGEPPGSAHGCTRACSLPPAVALVPKGSPVASPRVPGAKRREHTHTAFRWNCLDKKHNQPFAPYLAGLP